MTMKPEKIVQSTTVFLRDLFSSNLMYIPPYQRPYSWSVDNADDLWSDLIQCKNQPKDQHFIGPMYFKMDLNNGSLETTDGQQRLTTIMLLLLSIRRVIKNEFGNEEYAGIISQLDRELQGLTFFDKENSPRLLLGSSDKFAFQKLALNFSSIPEDVEEFHDQFDDTQTFLTSAIQLHHNFFFFVKKVNEIVEKIRINNGYNISDFKEVITPESKKYVTEVIVELTSIVNTLMDRFAFIKCNILTTDSSKTFKLFETINDRGKHLDQVDKIKNYLFKNIYNYYKLTNNEKDHENYLAIQNKWSEIQCELDNDIEDYIRYYLIQNNTLGAYIPPKNLFSMIENYFESNIDMTFEGNYAGEIDKMFAFKELCEKSIRLIDELFQFRKYYSAILEPEKTTITEDNIVRSNLKYVNNYKIMRALLLKILINYKSEPLKLRKYIIVTTNIAFLYVSIFEFRKLDTVERHIHARFFKPSDAFDFPNDFGKIMKKTMKFVYPDFEWSTALLRSKVQKLGNDQVSYYLQCKLNDYIQDEIKGGDFYFPDVLKRNTKESFNKDHILPVSFDADYRMKINEYFLANNMEMPTKKQLKAEYISRIGNIIPLKKDPNISKSNSSNPIEFYKDELPVKGILVQYLIRDYNDWCIEQILSRSEKIADLIVKFNVLTIDYDLAKY